MENMTLKSFCPDTRKFLSSSLQCRHTDSEWSPIETWYGMWLLMVVLLLFTLWACGHYLEYHAVDSAVKWMDHLNCLFKVYTLGFTGDLFIHRQVTFQDTIRPEGQAGHTFIRSIPGPELYMYTQSGKDS